MNLSDPPDPPPTLQPTRPPLAPTVADLMLVIVALALVAALIKRHTSDPTMNFRLAGHAPASVWTRLVLGHFMTGTGLVFGLSRLWARLRCKRLGPHFGQWLWSAVGLYLLFYIAASTAWSSVNFIRAAYFGPRAGGSGADLLQMVSLVAVMSSVQACFDSFAWFLAAIWAASALGRGVPQAIPDSGPVRPVPDKSDISIAAWSAVVIVATCFQRVLESLGL